MGNEHVALKRVVLESQLLTSQGCFLHKSNINSISTSSFSCIQEIAYLALFPFSEPFLNQSPSPSLETCLWPATRPTCRALRRLFFARASIWMQWTLSFGSWDPEHWGWKDWRGDGVAIKATSKQLKKVWSQSKQYETLVQMTKIRETPPAKKFTPRH